MIGNDENPAAPFGNPEDMRARHLAAEEARIAL
jgi:hypothetical protein